MSHIVTIYVDNLKKNLSVLRILFSPNQSTIDLRHVLFQYKIFISHRF